MSVISMSLFGLLSLLVFMTSTWLMSLKAKDASLVDRVWGMNFVVLAFIYFYFSEFITVRQFLVLTLVCIWGIRLSVHIYLRNSRHGEDYRYKKMREQHGKNFWWYSLFSVFLLQGFLAWIIAAPLLWVFAFPNQSFNFVDIASLFLWCLGFYFESVGDYQLKRFKSDPSNKGKVCDIGLWSLTRHPNYFGDAVISWSYFGFALSAEYGFLSFVGPLIMTLFLRYVSGVSLLEKNLQKTKPQYAEYMVKTPAFIPNIKKMFKRS